VYIRKSLLVALKNLRTSCYFTWPGPYWTLKRFAPADAFVYPVC
jgi:hypothetical protein